MRNEPRGFAKGPVLTRISVSGSGRSYTVRNGDEDPVRVWVRDDGLRCECGESRCAHIACLEMCGFIEPANQMRRAA
jgi:hypothetical protein